MAIEDVVAEHQRDGVSADELPADDEGVGEPPWGVLSCIGKAQADFRSITEKALKQVLILRRRNDENVANAGQHQGGERIVDHRLVEDREQLL